MSARLWGAALLLAACSPGPDFSRAAIDRAKLGVGFSPGFLMGTATAAHQVEGGNVNDWSAWEPGTFPDGAPHISDGTVSGLADDSYNLFSDDLAAMQHLGVNAYRFSVEWSRLEPQRGVWEQAVADHYHSWAQQLRAAGIQPMVTLFHFTLPPWVAAQGGWESDQTLDDFANFVGRVADALGDQVDLWCTVNEPNVYAYEAYLLGQWPPGKKDQALSMQVYARLVAAHVRAAQALRAHDLIDADGDGKATLIGIAHHVHLFQPATPSVLDTTIAGLSDDYFNEAIPRAVDTGTLHLEIPGLPVIDRAIPGLKGSFDYLGINYYTRTDLRGDLAATGFANQYTPSNRIRSDLGWDIFPEGLYRVLKRFGRYPWPIIITENGIADARGDLRPEFLKAHFYALQVAHQEGVDVRGYFHWSLMDNFEWSHGYSAKFGLYRVDFTQAALPRIPTQAVPVFQTIATNLGLTPTP